MRYSKGTYLFGASIHTIHRETDPFFPTKGHLLCIDAISVIFPTFYELVLTDIKLYNCTVNNICAVSCPGTPWPPCAPTDRNQVGSDLKIAFTTLWDHSDQSKNPKTVDPPIVFNFSYVWRFGNSRHTIEFSTLFMEI